MVFNDVAQNSSIHVYSMKSKLFVTILDLNLIVLYGFDKSVMYIEFKNVQLITCKNKSVYRRFSMWSIVWSNLNIL